MPIDANIDTSAIDKALLAIQTTEQQDIEPEFRKAAQDTVNFLTTDLRKGVPQVSGDLQSNLVGKVNQVVGTDVDMRIDDTTKHNGYDYGVRLDKDGKLHWRSGKYKGRRTFGWFSYVLKRNWPKAAKKYFGIAVTNIINRLAKRIS